MRKSELFGNLFRMSSSLILNQTGTFCTGRDFTSFASLNRQSAKLQPQFIVITGLICGGRGLAESDLRTL